MRLALIGFGNQGKKRIKVFGKKIKITVDKYNKSADYFSIYDEDGNFFYGYGKAEYAGFLDVPIFNVLPGPDGCSVGYSTNNNGNRIVSGRNTIKKQLKHRAKKR